MNEVNLAQSDFVTVRQGSNSFSNAKSGSVKDPVNGSRAAAATQTGATPLIAEAAGFYLDSAFETLTAKMDEFFGNFARQAADAGEGLLQAGKSVYAFEASVHASLKMLIEERSVTTSGNGQISQYRSRSVSIEAQIEVRVSAYRQVGNESLAMDGDYFSPANAAGRIVDFASGFLQTHMNLHPEQSSDEAKASFAELVRSAVTDGFNEAMALLGALPESILEQITETYDLVMQMLDEMFGPAL